MNKSLILSLFLVAIIASLAMVEGNKIKDLITSRLSGSHSGSRSSSSSRSSSTGSICSLPQQQGHCYASITRYHYDIKKGKCKSFRFGGCGGNGNNFATKSDCQKTCRGRSG